MSEAVEELLREAELDSSKPIDTSTPEGFKKYIEGSQSLDVGTIKKMIYHSHDADKIREFTEIYTDVLINRAGIEESAKEAFMQKVIDGYELTYNEGLYEGRSYGQMKRLSEQVKKQLNEPSQSKMLTISTEDRFARDQDSYVETTYSSTGMKVNPITNFIFENTRFINGDRGILTDVLVNNELLQKGIVFDKHSLVSLEAFRKTLPTEADIWIDPRMFMRFIKFIKNPARDVPRINVIDQTGLYKDEASGEYYFLIYDYHGQLQRITRNGTAITSEVYCQGILAPKTRARVKINSDQEKFQAAARTLINEVPDMLANHKSTIVIAWSFASLLSELFYENNLAFAMAFLFGEPQSGKSTLANMLAKMLGYKSTSDKIAFSSTAQPFKQAISSTNAFVILSEEFLLQKSKEAATIAFLKHVYNRDKLERGESNKQNSEYSLRAPLLLQGNSYVHNEAVADRCLPVHIRKSDQAMDMNKVTKLLKADLSHFLNPYLVYLIENQDKWHNWFQDAEQLVERSNGDQRGFSAASAIVLGIIMMNDLAEHVGANKIEVPTIQKIIKIITEQRSLANPKELYVRFLEFVQNRHTDEDVSKLKNTLLNKETLWINKSYWIQEFLDEAKNLGQESGEKDLLASLGEQPFISGTGEAVIKSMYGKTLRTLQIDIESLAKSAPSLSKSLWNDIRVTNSRIGAEHAAQELNEYAHLQAGEQELIDKLKKIKHQFDERQLEVFRNIGISLD
jgi:hypothetical protein